MKCQRCGITLPNLGDAGYKKAAEMEAEIASLKAELGAATGREAVLKAEAAEFYATEDGGWYAAWQSADRDRQALRVEKCRFELRAESACLAAEQLRADKARLDSALGNIRDIAMVHSSAMALKIVQIVDKALKEVSHA